ncbi:hypothetical protein [uncultured Bacteroides sp.]|uniref:hypothetical protein n=1 Tax=uncultured Bacteroides sp. TaxID=162156 RepID=UPI002AA7A0E7|nr:hypothetical protein [uncultured Bacteroides sp.]
MKKLFILLFFVCASASQLLAVEREDQHLTPDEFKAKQEAFITEAAKLSREEAGAFFPVYFELQDKKKEINDQAWNLFRKGKDDKTTEAQYDEIIEKIYDLRIASDKLEKAYFRRFKGILSSRKIYMVQKAEMRFHRELLKGMNRDDKHRK